MNNCLKPCCSLLTLLFLVQWPITQCESASPRAAKQYSQKRADLLKLDARKRFDAGVTLNDTEARVNFCLVKYRDVEIKRFINRKKGDTEPFLPAVYFPKAKPMMESSKLFPIIRRMPKGGALHIHSTLAGRAEWLVKKTAELGDSCYVFWPTPGEKTSGHNIGELFVPRPGKAPDTGFKLVKRVRAADPDFDRKLLNLITLGPEHETATNVWDDFGDRLKRIANFVQYTQQEYFYDAFQTLLNDNVQYAEIRAGFAHTGSLRKAADRIRQDTPEFDVKVILSNTRSSADPDDFDTGLDRIINAYRKNDTYILGYDIVGEEDPGNSLFEYAATALSIVDTSTIPFFFHAGESLWARNQNLYDAVLLKPKRIGHGFNLFLYPAVESLLIKNRIPLEICPISNQMLHYSKDLRLHPAKGYLRRGVQCVLSSDDPVVFGNYGLSYDFMMAFLAWELDMKAMKKLAMNSIEYSGMSKSEKEKHMGIWKKKWSAFVDYEYENLNKELFKNCVEK